MPRDVDHWVPAPDVRIGDRVQIDSERIGGRHGVPGMPVTGIIVAFHHHPPRAEIRAEPPDGQPARIVDLADVRVVHSD